MSLEPFRSRSLTRDRPQECDTVRRLPDNGPGAA
jgi:hypothetical protein